MTTASHAVSNAEALAWLRLSLVPGVSARMQHALLAEFGSPHSAVEASVAKAAAIIGSQGAQALARGANPAAVESTLSWLAQDGHAIVTLADADYPRGLLHAGDAPCVLYVRGKRELLNAPAIAIVGSRNATPGGLRDAEAFARTLSDAGLCIASGLALGIDAAAHRGGLAGTGSTIAVMGTGPDRVYPAANRALAKDIAATGCVLTEFPVGTPAIPGNFPRRNRLISGLARGVLVVEAAVRSGSLITARLAGEQGRDVFAIPGSIHSALSKGCHELIKQGAKLVESAEDILVELGMAQPQAAAATKETSHPLLRAMGHAPMSIDELAASTGLDIASLSGQLSQLEVEGRVAALAGGRFQRLRESP